MNKRAQAQIITTVLIILLVLAAVVIVWQLVDNLVSGGAEAASDAEKCFKVNLDLVSADVTADEIRIKREVGNGDLRKIAVVVDGDRADDIDATGFDELDEQDFSISADITGGEKIEIYAIVGDSEQLCGLRADNFIVP